MNDKKLESLLLGARQAKPGKHNPFTDTVMAQIKRPATFEANARITNTTKWSSFMRLIHAYKVTAVIAGLLFLSVVSLSGYAYASGTDPVSLVKRWIANDAAHVEYQGRQFKHGKAVTYSDAAITAFAELSTIGRLAFDAGNAYTVPKNGLEHVVNPFTNAYFNPWVGTVKAVDGDAVTVERQFQLGDKVAPAHDLDEVVILETNRINTYVAGEPTAVSATVGKLVVVHSKPYMEYRTGSGEKPTPVTHNFAYVLTHSLDEVKEAEKDGKKEAEVNDDNAGLFETSYGKMSDVCLNNGADRCTKYGRSPAKGQTLYGDLTASGQGMSQYNSKVISFGEGLHDAIPSPVIVRGVEGTIVAMTDRSISLKSSSGQLWVLGYTAEQRAAFDKQVKTDLKIGDTLSGSVLGSVFDLDSRTYENSRIYELVRY